MRNKIAHYNPQASKKSADQIIAKDQMQNNNYDKIDNIPLKVDLFFKIKNTNKTNSTNDFVIKKPDVDNYVKYYLDVLKGIAYKDDNIISCIFAIKQYSDKDETIINLSRMDDFTMIECIKFKQFEKGSLKGFADFRFPEKGIEIYGCSVHEKDGRKWVNLPSREFEKDGERKFAQIIRFTSNDDFNYFLRESLKAVEKQDNKENDIPF